MTLCVTGPAVAREAVPEARRQSGPEDPGRGTGATGGGGIEVRGPYPLLLPVWATATLSEEYIRLHPSFLCREERVFLGV